MPESRGVAVFVIAVAILVQASLVASDKQTRTFTLPRTRTLSIAITVGDLEITGVAGQEAVVTIERQVPKDADLQRLPLDIEETDKEVRVRCLQRDTTDPALRCDITARVPREAAIGAIQMMEGRLKLHGLSGSVNADVRRGPIEAGDVQGMIRLESGIGDVVVNQARLTPGGLLRLRAFNGDVRLTLAERPRNARILALALNGTITSQIPLNTKESWGPRWGEATLGTGEPVISLDVITGRIEIKSP